MQEAGRVITTFLSALLWGVTKTGGVGGLAAGVFMWGML
jgi:hypothetical protein